ncbi:MAG: endonuclease/exonuclease/phosphatase family protein [Oscillospiraceae bacterium]|nr:endonuclease/exonuclease/phosphatase family protein [Oscillospiraceae bacterium]
MKILTINTHSLQEENYPQKFKWFIEAILRERPDIIAMQEVNQTMSAPSIDTSLLDGYFPAPYFPSPSHPYIPIRQDNHAAQTARYFWESGIPCSWTWLPIKRGYDKYDEGLALFSLNDSIIHADAFRISNCSDYGNWRTRKILGIQLENNPSWFYTVHMGWWADKEEPFQHQWNVLNTELSQKRKAAPVWLLGDFNAPAGVQGESYDCIRYSGWQDTYLLAAQKDDGLTVEGVIDGWCDQLDPSVKGMRIDYIWCSHSPKISYSYVLFNGKREPVVSDHFGILIETE